MGYTYYPPSPGKLNAAGEEIGPCALGCVHTDCAQMRKDAKAPCHYCRKPLGYARRVYFEPITTPKGVEQQIVHATCAEHALRQPGRGNRGVSKTAPQGGRSR